MKPESRDQHSRVEEPLDAASVVTFRVPKLDMLRTRCEGGGKGGGMLFERRRDDEEQADVSGGCRCGKCRADASTQ